MFVPLWLLGLLAVAFVMVVWLALRRQGGDMITRQQREIRSATPLPPLRPQLPPEEAAFLGIPEIAAALVGGNKIEAIKLVRERSGLGLREAKELVERLQSH